MKIYITDGTELGFLTAIHDAYRQQDAFITSSSNLQIDLMDELIYVKSDEEKSTLVAKTLAKYDKYLQHDISLALRSCDSQKENILYRLIKDTLDAKHSIRKAYQLASVVDFATLKQKITSELHNMKGFLRFMEMSGGIMYAAYSPDNDITDLLTPHFVARMNDISFVIHDVKRKKASLYNGKEWIMSEVGNVEIYLSQYEKTFENLWKQYYNSVNIVNRPHEKQMKKYMPVRYWKFLPEKN